MSGAGGAAAALRGRFGRRFRPRTRPRFERAVLQPADPEHPDLLGLCAGLVAIRFALDGRWAQAAALIVVAGVIDGLDGRLARLLKATSRFGAEFDSLSDFLCFGVAPALVLYLWTLQDGLGARLGLRALPAVRGLLRAAAGAVQRLARALPAVRWRAAPKPAYAYNFFTGVPAPAGAGCALFPLFAALAFGEWGWRGWPTAIRHPVFVGGRAGGGRAR